MAVAPNGAGDSPGMGKEDLKKNLMIAKRGAEMHCAIGLGGDGKPVILFDKIKKGASLHRDLGQVKNARWGHVEIDPENAKRCIFVMNKASGGGMARKLIVALKGTGFNKVIIKLEDGSVEESGEGEEEELEAQDGEGAGQTRNPEVLSDDQASPETQPQDTAPAQASSTDAAQTMPTDQQPAPADQTAQPTDQAAQPADASQQQGAQPDAAGIAKDLTGLVKQMLQVIAADPTQKSALAELATDAQASLKRGDLQQAAAGTEMLRQALSDAGNSSQPAASNGQAPADPTGASTTTDTTAQAAQPATTAQQAPTDTSAQPATNGNDAPDPSAQAAAPAIAKARTAWSATRTKVEGDLGKLHNAFGTAFKGHDQEQEISKAFRERVETVLNTLDEELSETLDSVNKARSRQERDQLVERARAILAKHRQHVSSDPTIQALDSNPFVPLTIAKTMATTIDALSRSIR